MAKRKLRKSLPITRSIWIQPSDAAIDWKKTVDNVCKETKLMEWLKLFEKSELPLAEFTEQFRNEAKPLSVYTMYTLAGFKSDLIVAKEGQRVLHYHFEEFTLSDSKHLTKTQAVKEGEESKDALEELKDMFDKKLITVVGVDEGFSRAEIIESCVEDLQMKDIEMFNRFITESIALNVEKKSISES